MRLSRPWQAGLLGLALGLGALGCGSKPPPVAAHVAHDEPHWQDVLETMPEVLVVLRPRALHDDKLYGPLLTRAIAASRDRSGVVGATHLLEPLADAEQIVLGWRPQTGDHPEEFVLAALGVRADVDPAKLAGDDGQPFWTPGPAGATRELVHEQDAHGHVLSASLFELPGRTWVVATGPARLRARQAFAHPLRRPQMDLDPAALASVRLDGPSVVGHVGLLQDRGDLAAVGKHLRSVTLVVPPGGEGAVKVTLAYADEDAAAFAEVAIREVSAAITRVKSERMAWLGKATVERPDRRVVVTAPLPASLVDALLSARSSSAPLDLDLPPAPR